jgi:hypothetical protein
MLVELKIRMFAYHPSCFPHPSSPPFFAVSRPVCAISFFRVISIPGFHLPNLNPPQWTYNLVSTRVYFHFLHHFGDRCKHIFSFVCPILPESAVICILDFLSDEVM